MKALISIILLLGIAATVFVAGWITLWLPPNTYAVLFSKTGGYDETVIEPGVFVWRWERVIPTNVTLHLFELEPRTIQTSSRGQLPSGELLATVLPAGGDFSYEVAFDITFRILPEALPKLVAEEALTPESLDDWYQRRADTIGNAADELLQEPANSDRLANPGRVEQRLRDQLSGRFADIDLLAIEVRTLDVPDLELYERARRAYFELLEAQDLARKDAVSNLAQQRERDMAARESRAATIELLRQYGEVLEEYPVLVEFLALRRESGTELDSLLDDIPVGAESDGPAAGDATSGGGQ